MAIRETEAKTVGEKQQRSNESLRFDPPELRRTAFSKQECSSLLQIISHVPAALDPLRSSSRLTDNSSGWASPAATLSYKTRNADQITSRLAWFQGSSKGLRCTLDDLPKVPKLAEFFKPPWLELSMDACRDLNATYDVGSRPMPIPVDV
ncbi:hypothetical protein NUW58_g427 [Xylaria curta]|uniref:Uncharacterized protein n=1 Tax=Xylaria curta TaxID=42375 RepID=A0ACC1PPA2_9PEZI|nr:hypothetical protein NUW58_g427 [Xylaria curta]